MSFNINKYGKLIKYFPEKSETDIVIPDGVKIIGKEAFAEKTNLNSVIIPESVVKIEAKAFLACENLLYIDIPDSVEKIGDSAFCYCYALERVKLPRGLKFLDRCVFNDCDSLSEITIPDDLTKIGDYAFDYCESLAHITLPKNLTEIGQAAFRNCESLEFIEIPEGVTFIGRSAFSMSGLSRAVIPKSIKTIGENAFICTYDLVTNISIADWEKNWGISKERYALSFMNSYTPGDPFFEDLKEENNRTIRELLYDIVLALTPENDIKALWYLINEEMLEVEDIEFLSEKMINDAEIVATLLDYKKTRFSEEYMRKWEQDKLDKALGIKEYTYRDWNRSFKLVKTNGEYAVEKYRGNDETVIVPGKIEGMPVTSILPWAFEELDNIKSVFIGESITQIGSGTFSDCSLAEITLPETLRSIGSEAFSECMNLTEIIIPSNVTDIGEDAFRSCRSLARVTLPDKITAINGYSFCDSGIREIVIPEGVESIEEYAFANCKKLVNVTLPRSLQRIERDAFEDSLSIKKIVLYGDLCSISPTAFAGIKELTIVAPAGSYAMKFALENGYKFEELEPPESPEQKGGK